MQPDDSTKPVVVREPDASKGARPVLRGGSSREARSLPSNPAFEQARTRFVEGLAHFGAARWAEAEQSFEAALALMPGRPSVLTNLGATRLRLGRPAEALPLLEQAVQAEPDNQEAWAYLAAARAETGAPEPALAALDRAIALNGKLPALWRERGALLVHLGRPGDALQAFERVTALVPDDADAWAHQGTLHREAGQLPLARQCFERARALGASGEVMDYFLAAVDGGAAPQHPPRAYVAHLFDEYADDFQTHLVEVLGYRAHEAVVDLALARLPRAPAAALDLGCGTGLCAQRLRPHVPWIDGVDLSARMVAAAQAAGVYDRVFESDLVDYLARADRLYDLVIAADVFIYVGALEAVFEGVARTVPEGGLLAFSVEALEGPGDWQLLTSLRYAHSLDYVHRLAASTGWTVLAVTDGTLRCDQRKPVAGHYVCLQRVGAAG